jgi:hypothetical protein
LRPTLAFGGTTAEFFSEASKVAPTSDSGAPIRYALANATSELAPSIRFA